MKSSLKHSGIQKLEDMPEAWRLSVESELSPQEAVVAWLDIDLDRQLHFSSGLVVATGQRLLARDPGTQAWSSWSYRSDLVLRHHDHAGVGTLELCDAHGLVSAWRYTMGHHPAALQLIACFDQERDRHVAISAASRESERESEPAVAGRQTGVDTDRPNREKLESPGPGQELTAQEIASEEKSTRRRKRRDKAARRKAHPARSSTASLLRLWRFARPYRMHLLAGFLLTVASTAAALVAPYLTMPLMDDILIPFQNGKPIDYGLVRLYLGALLVSSLLAWGLGWARTYILAWVSERIGADLRVTTYAHLQNLSLHYFGGKRTGDLISRIGSESDRICIFLSLHLLDFATDVLVIVMTAAILVSINPWLAIVTLVPLPFIAWLIHLVRDRLRHGFEKADRIWAEITNVLADTIPGIRVVKAFAQERREVARFQEANKRNLAVNDRVNTVWSLFSPTVTLLTEIGLLIVWAFGIWLVSASEITVGVLAAFLTYISRFYIRLDSMSRIVSFTEKAAAGAKRIFDILDHVSSVPEPANPVHIKHVQGRIELRRVGFRYGNRSVLKGINLDIAPGEMIGLVGHSGSGKSTLVNLICRFYDVSSGTIRLDGVDIRSLPISEYRASIGLVLQEPFLFFGTVAENIAYGKPDATRQDIIAAARAANAHDFILRLPHGYDSLVGERGQALSGGERQRISIARALLIDPRILILDEATSAVDTATEHEIQKALDNLVKGRTTISIAHRLSTLRQADRLVVLDHGEIVEVGNHDELMAREGAYFRLQQAQLELNADPVPLKEAWDEDSTIA